MAARTHGFDWYGMVKTVPAIVLSIEFFIGGFPRVSPWPFRALHQKIYQKSIKTAPKLYPILVFRDARMQMIYIGLWMMSTGVLLATPNTRGSLGTLGLVYFWTGAGAWSQARTEMPYWLPVCNALLGTLVFIIDRR